MLQAQLCVLLHNTNTHLLTNHIQAFRHTVAVRESYSYAGFFSCLVLSCLSFLNLFVLFICLFCIKYINIYLFAILNIWPVMFMYMNEIMV